jgi:hypothetical protein
MPELLHLEIDNSGPQPIPIMTHLISNLTQHRSTSDSLIPKLHTLSLKHILGTFSAQSFVTMVESRWFKPGSDLSAAMSSLGIGCIRSVTLMFQGKVDAEVYKPLRILDEEGLRVVVAGSNGVVC